MLQWREQHVPRSRGKQAQNTCWTEMGKERQRQRDLEKLERERAGEHKERAREAKLHTPVCTEAVSPRPSCKISKSKKHLR